MIDSKSYPLASHNLIRLWALPLFNYTTEFTLVISQFILLFASTFNMTDDTTTHKLHVEKLVADGSNWVTYRDRMMWALRSRRLQDHLTSTTPTAVYTACGTVDNVTPQMRWDNDEAMAMYTIAASIPNSVFTSVKSNTTAKDVWDALKALYEGRTTMVLVKTS
jgi:hypothetical protein